MKIKKTKHKHQSSVPPGFFIYKGIEVRYSDEVNPDIRNEYIDEDLKEKMRAVIVENKDFCEQYCSQEFWQHTSGEELCYLYRVKRKLNELHVSKSPKGKYKCNLRKTIC